MAPTKPIYTGGGTAANPVDLTGVASGRIDKTPATPNKKKKAPALATPPASHGTACQACRKGKARCVRVTSCERCLRMGVPCPSEEDGPNAKNDVLVHGNGSKSCARCRKLKAACRRQVKCVGCEKKGIDCVVGPGRGV